MAQPKGYVDDSKSNHACKLNHALYGLKQATRAWFDNIESNFNTMGFSKLKIRHIPLHFQLELKDYILVGLCG